MSAKHGGKREGAGRPKELKKPTIRSLYFDVHCMDRITMKMAKTGLDFSKAVRALILGL